MFVPPSGSDALCCWAFDRRKTFLPAHGCASHGPKGPFLWKEFLQPDGSFDTEIVILSGNNFPGAGGGVGQVKMFPMEKFTVISGRTSPQFFFCSSELDTCSQWMMRAIGC